jgi:Protein of unknown function (DUF2612)
MSIESIKSYYSDLLIKQYKKTKAIATIKSLAKIFIMDLLPLSVQDAYALDTSTGVQLDVLAKYIGASRVNNTSKGLVTLADDDFRKLLKLVLIKNNSGSSVYDIEKLLAQNFPNQIRFYDSTNMSLNYIISEDVGTAALLDILLSGVYLPAPMGVGVSVISVPSFTDVYFGFTNYEETITGVAPFNFYELVNTTYKWLQY